MSQRARLGWDPFFENQLQQATDVMPEAVVSRVVDAQRGEVFRLAGDFDGWAGLSGRLRHEALTADVMPAVGDWVVATAGPAGPGTAGRAVIHRRFDRRSVIVRAAAGRADAPQVIAANIDTVFVVTAAAEDLNARRLERYLAMVWSSGAVPVVIVNKRDLAEDEEALRLALRERLSFVDVIAVSALNDERLDALTPYLGPAQTVALVGSSGVGKSTLVNRLVGHDVQRVSATSESDGRGRHTTTARRLIELPGGALLIDTPGMRELQPWVEHSAMDAAFDDLAELAARCRYRNCRHDDEPGCAVRDAVETGRLDPDRLRSYRQLLKEAAFEGRKHDKSAAAAHKALWKRLARAQKALYEHRRDRDGLK